jgi:hypothetical protein
VSWNVCNVTPIEVVFVDSIEAQNVGIAFLSQVCPVMPVDGEVETEIGRVMHRMGVMGGIPHDLFRHATDVHARTPQRPGLNYRRPGAILGSTLRVCKAAASTTNYDQVKICCHASFLFNHPGICVISAGSAL